MVVQVRASAVYIYMYIYIARCQVVVKFYKDLYFGYNSRYRNCGDWTDIDF